MDRGNKSRYVDQLEHTNKLLMQTIEKINLNLSKATTENQKLLESKSILRELLDKQLPQIEGIKADQKPLDKQKMTKFLRMIGLLVLSVGVILVIILLLYHFGILHEIVLKIPQVNKT
jgi:regulator of replication initiation timing